MQPWWRVCWGEAGLKALISLRAAIGRKGDSSEHPIISSETAEEITFCGHPSKRLLSVTSVFCTPYPISPLWSRSRWESTKTCVELTREREEERRNEREEGLTPSLQVPLQDAAHSSERDGVITTQQEALSIMPGRNVSMSRIGGGLFQAQDKIFLKKTWKEFYALG